MAARVAFDALVAERIRRARSRVLNDASTIDDIATLLATPGYRPAAHDVTRGLYPGHPLLVDVLNYGDVVQSGPSGLVSMLCDPTCSIALGDTHLLLRATRLADTAVATWSKWHVERSANGTVEAVHRLVEVDEHDLSSPHLEDLLIDWAVQTGFVPSKPRAKTTLITTAALAERLGIIPRFTALAAVHDSTLKLVTLEVPLRDTKRNNRAAREILSSGSQHIVTVTTTAEKALRKFADGLAINGRTYTPLRGQHTDVLCAEFRDLVCSATTGMALRPFNGWGPDAVARIRRLECDSFVLTDLAVRHLAKNPYPDPERMLDHLERLSVCAAGWHEQVHTDGTVNAERFVEYARTSHDLTIALFDGRLAISAFSYGGTTYDSRPHLKVDDAVAETACGRIYFALDDRPKDNVRRIIIDHIGLHDR